MIRVAIVEDNKSLRGSLAVLIGGTAGLELVGSFADAESAIERLPASSPDIVLMDIQLPQLSGIECTRALIEKNPSIQIIILSIHQNEGRVFEALRAGAIGYLAKDSAPSFIIEAIEEAHRGGSPMSSGIARLVVSHYKNLREGAVAESSQADEMNLSPRETEIVELLIKGYRYKDVANHFDCSFHTVREHLRRVYVKLHVTSSREAVVKYMRQRK